MKKDYPYLKDMNFLNKIYGQHNKTVYCNITSLDWAENPLQEIQGKIISASISCNGDSIVRRTGNLSIKIQDQSDLYSSTDSLFAINRKIFLETGINNGFRHLGPANYPEYSTIWFPFGVYVITNYSISHDSSGLTVNLNISDKMSLLNGDAGGVLPASVNFESVDTLGPDGDLNTEYIRLNQLIPELVHHFGGEDLHHIIVNDIPNQIKQVLKWRGNNVLYLYQDSTNPKNSFYTTSVTREIIGNYRKRTIPFNYDAGYTFTDFVYPGELAGGAGDSVCTILDKIKSTLGNYEYYYDVFGNFIFQENQNNINTTAWRAQWSRMVRDRDYGDNDVYLPYVLNPYTHSSTYSFENSDFIISYNNNPQFNMIKNDFIVWGMRKSSSGLKLPCRYHLAIDTRPQLVENKVVYQVVFDTNIQDRIRRAFFIDRQFDSLAQLKEELPVGIVGKYYLVGSKDVYTWVTDTEGYNIAAQNMSQIKDDQKPITRVSATPIPGYVYLPFATYYASFTIPPTTNWRNILYWGGLEASHRGTDYSEYYWAELCNEWPKVYDIENDQWYTDKIDMPSGLDWWLDIIDNNSELNKFSVSSIGRRSYAKTDDSCNCVFEPDIPDIVMVDTSVTSDVVDSRSKKTCQELLEQGLYPVQVGTPIYDNLLPGGTFNSCYQHVRQLLTDYTNYNENISVTCLPIYHLEPNTRVSFNDPESGIYGDYMINSISFNLGYNGTMTINAKKCVEKI